MHVAGMNRATLQVSPENTPGHRLSGHMGFRDEMAPLSSHNRREDCVSGPLLFSTPLIKQAGTTSPPPPASLSLKLPSDGPWKTVTRSPILTAQDSTLPGKYIQPEAGVPPTVEYSIPLSVLPGLFTSNRTTAK